MSIFCVQCGTELPDDAKFCLKCGKVQGSSNTPEQPKKHGNNEVELYRTELKGNDLCIITTQQIIVHRKKGELERIPLNIITKVQPGNDIAILSWNRWLYIDSLNRTFGLQCKSKKQIFELANRIQEAILK